MLDYITASDGARVAFERAGQPGKPALLLFHCLPGSHDYWREAGYIAALGDRFTIAAVDTRGFGASDAPDNPAAYAEERVLADMLAVADALGAERFSAWGHSYGATIARQLAATSDRVSRVVMAGGVFGPVFTSEFIAELEEELAPFANAQAAADPRAALAALDVPPEEMEDALAYPARTTQLTMRSLTGWRPFQPGDLRCPALVLTGDRDTRVRESLEAPEQRAAIAATDGRVRVVTLPNLDHEQLVTERAAVLPAVLPFLSVV